MATERQIAANQLSALRSTGPRTIEGRAASRLNSLRHGLTARKLLIPGETAERFDRFCADMRAELGPQGPLEESLVDTLTGTLWRLQRIPVLEAALCNWVDQKLVEKDEKAADPMSTKFDWEPNMLASRTPVAQEEADNERTQQLHLGRLTEVIADKDFLSKLSRYEAHLVNQARKILADLDRLIEMRSQRDRTRDNALSTDEK